MKFPLLNLKNQSKQNEEKILSSCIEKLQFCDEIVIVLDKCSDNSKNIARKYPMSTAFGVGATGVGGYAALAGHSP